jgi:hypothetical protein
MCIKFWLGDPKGRDPPGIPGVEPEDDITATHKENWRENINWIELV